MVAPQTSTVHADCLSMLAQSHSDFLLGAFARLTHNAKDAGTTTIKINVETKASTPSYTLVIEDDGNGMSEKQLHNMMRFGKEAQSDGSSDIAGKYGIGYKSHYSTVVTRQKNGPLSNVCFVSLLNPLCKSPDGSLLTPHHRHQRGHARSAHGRARFAAAVGVTQQADN